jgi:hypothetical protein
MKRVAFFPERRGGHCFHFSFSPTWPSIKFRKEAERRGGRGVVMMKITLPPQLPPASDDAIAVDRPLQKTERESGSILFFRGKKRPPI